MLYEHPLSRPPVPFFYVPRWGYDTTFCSSFLIFLFGLGSSMDRLMHPFHFVYYTLVAPASV
jgi:hypothetical protein